MRQTTTEHELLRPGHDAADAARLAELRAEGAVWREHDLVASQLEELIDIRLGGQGEGASPAERAAAQEALLEGVAAEALATWVWYPWSGRLLHILRENLFRELRAARNRDKITVDEQRRLRGATIGIVGLSVGNAVAVTLAQEGVGGRLILADFDTLSTANLNRVRAPLHDVGLPKTVVAARQLAEIDPFLEVRCLPEGLTEGNLAAFVEASDVVVDECDDLAMKVRLRLVARARRRPVLMETSDRGKLDIERFDQEPDRPLLHGRLATLEPERLVDLDDDEKVALVAQTVGYDLTTRAAASLLEIGETLATWPQLASDVAHGGASVCAAARRLILGQPLPSGRRVIDMAAILAEAPDDALPSAPVRGLRALPPPPPPLSELQQVMIEAAVRAPSGGNAQPWWFAPLPDDGLEVGHDPSRSAPLLDRDGLAGLLAVGAAIEGLALEASAHGLALEVVPTGAAEGPVARVRPAPAGRPPDRLARWVHQRHTERRCPPRAALPPPLRGAMEAAVHQAGARLHLVEAPERLEVLGKLIGAVDRVRFLHAGLHQEMMAELRWSEDEADELADGISLPEMALSPADEPALRLLRRPDVVADLRERGLGGALTALSERWVESASAMGLIVAMDRRPEAVLAAGRGFHRMWLEASAAGFGIQPLGVVLYLIRHLGTDLQETYRPDERAVLAEAQDVLEAQFPEAGAHTPVMLFRVCTSTGPYARSRRRPLSEVVREASRPGSA